MLNALAAARGLVGWAHPETRAELFRAVGQRNEGGVMTTTYDEGREVLAQTQSATADALVNAENVSDAGQTRRAYLSATEGGISCVSRFDARSGDMLRFEDGSWWLVDAVLEDFTASGWTCVRVTRQLEGPRGATDGR